MLSCHTYTLNSGSLCCVRTHMFSLSFAWVRTCTHTHTCSAHELSLLPQPPSFTHTCPLISLHSSTACICSALNVPRDLEQVVGGWGVCLTKESGMGVGVQGPEAACHSWEVNLCLHFLAASAHYHFSSSLLSISRQHLFHKGKQWEVVVPSKHRSSFCSHLLWPQSHQ